MSLQESSMVNEDQVGFGLDSLEVGIVQHLHECSGPDSLPLYF